MAIRGIALLLTLMFGLGLIAGHPARAQGCAPGWCPPINDGTRVSALQDHGDLVSYRHFKIRTLP